MLVGRFPANDEESSSRNMRSVENTRGISTGNDDGGEGEVTDGALT